MEHFPRISCRTSSVCFHRNFGKGCHYDRQPFSGGYYATLWQEAMLDRLFFPTDINNKDPGGGPDNICNWRMCFPVSGINLISVSPALFSCFTHIRPRTTMQERARSLLSISLKVKKRAYPQGLRISSRLVSTTIRKYKRHLQEKGNRDSYDIPPDPS